MNNVLAIGMVDPPPRRPESRDWLEWPRIETRQPIRAISTKWGNRGTTDGGITLSDLTEKEVKAVEAMLLGQAYVTCFRGRLHAYSVNEPLPDAMEDPLLGPHWSLTGEPKEYGGPPPNEGWHSPSIIVSHVGAGTTSREEPIRSQRILNECGFVCLRSPRGTDGRYWEQWVLHSLHCATGRLKDHMDSLKGLDWHQSANAAAEFIALNLDVRFGTLDITIQRWALRCPD